MRLTPISTTAMVVLSLDLISATQIHLQGKMNMKRRVRCFAGVDNITHSGGYSLYWGQAMKKRNVECHGITVWNNKRAHVSAVIAPPDLNHVRAGRPEQMSDTAICKRALR